jgi:exosortase
MSSPDSSPILSEPSPARSRLAAPLLTAVALGAGCLFVYWPTLCAMAERWSSDPQYSHGYLVPVFALFLLWHRRPQNATGHFRGTPWGLLVVVAGLGLRLVGTYFYLPWVEAVSLLPCLAGICLLLGGWNALRWSWPAVAFLVFMLPLPYQVELALAHPLRRLATRGSTFALEVLGFHATAEGNVIWLNDDTRLGVVEACGGLSMLLTFFALAVAFALVLRRPLLDKVLIVASALPIALLANVLRITLTGALHETAGSEVAFVFFHDLAGWFMMFLALGLLWLELQVLSRLLVEPEAAAPVPL